MNKKFLLVALFLLVAGAGFFLVFNRDPGNKPYAPAEWKDWQSGFVTGKNPEVYWGFTLKYPRDFDRSWDVDALANAFLDGADGHVKFALPEDAFMDTKSNFAGAWLTVSHRKNTSESECFASVDEAGQMSETRTINGISYRIDATADAGAGNFYRSTVYRTLDRGTCFEAVTTLHTTNVANYPDRTVKEFDLEKAESVFREILGTVMFTDKSPY